MNNSQTLNLVAMTSKEECNVFLYHLTENIVLDWYEQKRNRRHNLGEIATNAAKMFPHLMKASHLRTARNAAKKILSKEKPDGLAPCTAITATIAYLFHGEGRYRWPNVRKFVLEKGREYASLLESKPRPGGFQEEMITEIVKVGPNPSVEDGNYLKQYVDLLVRRNEELKTQKEKEFEYNLKQYKQELKTLEELYPSVPAEEQPKLKGLIDKIRERISFYESM